MAFGEPLSVTEERRRRMTEQFPMLADTEPGRVLAVDNYGIAQGQPVTPFSQTAMALAAYNPDTPDTVPNAEPWGAPQSSGDEYQQGLADRAFEQDAVDQAASGFGRGPVSPSWTQVANGRPFDYFNKQDVVTAPVGDNAPGDQYNPINSGVQNAVNTAMDWGRGVMAGQHARQARRAAGVPLNENPFSSTSDNPFNYQNVLNATIGNPAFTASFTPPELTQDIRKNVPYVGNTAADLVNMAGAPGTYLLGGFGPKIFGEMAAGGATLEAGGTALGANEQQRAQLAQAGMLAGPFVRPGVQLAKAAAPRAKTWMEAFNTALDDARGAEAKILEAQQVGRASDTDALFTAGPNGEPVGPTGNVSEMRLGREPARFEDQNRGLRSTNYGRAEQANLAAEEQAAFRGASDRAIAGADAPIGGGAPMRDVSRSARPNQQLGDDAIEAIRMTPGAEMNPDGTLTLDLVRFQVPGQAGEESVRAGTFYMPESGSPYERHFRPARGQQKAASGYGGSDRVQTRSTFQDPLLVQAAAGGKAPEAAYDYLKGRKAYETMRNDVLDNAMPSYYGEARSGSQTHIQQVAAVLEKYGVNPDEAYNIVRNSTQGNQLAYAIQERIVSQAVKDAGYDGVIGYSKKLKGAPRLTEVFDVRSDYYPVPGEGLDVADFYQNRTQPPPGGGIAGGADVPAGTNTITDSLANARAGEGDRIGSGASPVESDIGASAPGPTRDAPYTIDLRRGFAPAGTPAETMLEALGADAGPISAGGTRAALTPGREGFTPRGTNAQSVVHLDSLQLEAGGEPAQTLALMRRIAEEADRNGVTVTLDAVPYETLAAARPDTGRLQAFYRRYGFVDSGDGSMVRAPGPAAADPFARFDRPVDARAGALGDANPGVIPADRLAQIRANAQRIARGEQPIGGGADLPGGEVPMAPAAQQPALAAERTYLKRLFNVDAPEPRLDAGDKFAGAVRAIFGGVREDEIATPIVKMIEQSKPRIQNQAARMGSVIEAEANGAFKRDALGRVADLPGAPTIQTIAARLPEYESLLNPQQLTAMERIRGEVADYRPLVDEAGIELGNRRDIMDGGFYLPRGKVVSVKGRRVPAGGGGRGGGSAGYRKEAVFDSMEQGLEAGYRYEPLASAVSRHVEQTGGDAVRKYAETLFKGATDEAGDLLGTSQADRLDPTLRATVNGLRAKIAGRMQTLRNQTARAGVQGQAASEVGREASRLERLSVSAETRAVLRKAKIEEFDVSTPDAILESFPSIETLRSEADALRAQLAQRTGARGLANRLGEKEGLIALRQAAEQSGGDVDRMLDIVNQYGEQSARYGEAAAPRPATRGATAPAFGTPERTQWELDRRSNGINRQRGAVRRVGADAPFDGPPAAYQTYDDILAHAIESSSVDTSRVPSSEAAIRAAERELSVLTRESRRAQARAGMAASRLERAGESRAVTQYELDVLRGELDDIKPRYQSAVNRAAQTPLFEGQIDLPGLRGTSFPGEVANAANRRLDNMRPPTGKASVAVKAAQAVNAMLRMTGSTLDVSGTALQGLLGAANDPRAYGSALKTSVRGWWNPDSLGAYFSDFDRTRAAAGKPTSKDWAAVGQRINSNLTEYTGEGLPDAIRKAYEGAIPGTGRIVQGGLNPARGANRQFGFFGDVLRNELSDTAYDIASGARNQFGMRGTAQPVSREVMADIAQGSNRMTGWSTRRFGGDVGELALFAPRFFQANVETLLDAVKGLRPGASASQAQARNSLLRLIGVGTALTVAANEARGKETDFRLTVNGHDNPNFMRLMDVGGQDISLFGTFDRLVHLVAKTATGQKASAARSFLNSPIVGRSWDLIAGEDAVGNRVRDTPEQFATYLLKSVAPFSGQSYYQGAQQAVAGDYGAAAATVGVGASGLRGSPMTTTEQVNAGRYGELKGQAQADAIRPQAWRLIAADPQAPKGLDQYASYYDWAQALRDYYMPRAQAEARARRLSDAEAANAVENQIADNPVTKAWEAARTKLKNQWVIENPQQALDLYNAEQANYSLTGPQLRAAHLRLAELSGATRQPAPAGTP